MYEYITGKLSELTPTYAIIEAAGIGYFINISLTTFSSLEGKEGKDGERLFLHYVVREDAQLFYGFSTKAERELFQHLISVSGIGATTARMVLSTFSPAELKTIIMTDNSVSLKSVKGLGIKGAQKIIVELRDKMVKLTAVDGASGEVVVSSVDSATSDEALAALVMLGFSKASCKKVVADICKSSPGSGVEEIIRLALKRL